MDIADFEHEYREQWQPLFTDLASRIVETVQQVVEDTGIPVAHIEHRAKTVKSFVEKIERKAYKDPFGEIKDFAGIRWRVQR